MMCGRLGVVNAYLTYDILNLQCNPIISQGSSVYLLICLLSVSLAM